MAIYPHDAEELLKAGFKLDYILEGSSFYFEDETWIIGGRSYPNGPTSASPKVIKEGIWLPNIEDFLRWLRFRDFEIEIKTSRYGTTVTAHDSKENPYKASSSSPEYALFEIIMQVLKFGNVPEWNTFTVEIID